MRPWASKRLNPSSAREHRDQRGDHSVTGHRLQLDVLRVGAVDDAPAPTRSGVEPLDLAPGHHLAGASDAADPVNRTDVLAERLERRIPAFVRS